MGLFDLFKRAPKARKRFRPRAYAGAAVTRLTADWGTTSLSADGELYGQLDALRARSRQQERDNAYAKKFLSLVEMNLVGAQGVQLQNKTLRAPGGELDTVANDKVEQWWKQWGRRGVCDVTGRHTWNEIERLVVKAVARDGEVLLRLFRAYPNGHGFAVQLLEADFLDSAKNELRGNNRISMGIETDPTGRRVAYWLFDAHPGELLPHRDLHPSRPVPAEDVLHIYLAERPGQRRGVPWMHAALDAMKQLGAFEEAAIVAARIGASKMGFFTSETGEEYGGEEEADGSVTTQAEPGSFEQLPAGFGFQEFSPDYPHAIFADFVRRCLQRISSGLGCAYQSLSGDLQGTSFSSGRIGLLEERERWKVLQQWLIEQLHGPVFAEGLLAALLTQQVKLPPSGYPRFLAPSWHARRWQWVDPLKDVQALVIAKEERLKAPSQITAEAGDDYEELCRQIQRDRQIREKYGLGDEEPQSTQPQEEPDDGQP